MAEQIGKNRARFTFDEVRAATGAQGEESGEVTGVATDSRQVEVGNLFLWPLRGEKFDGHDFSGSSPETGLLSRPSSRSGRTPI